MSLGNEVVILGMFMATMVVLGSTSVHPEEAMPEANAYVPSLRQIEFWYPRGNPKTPRNGDGRTTFCGYRTQDGAMSMRNTTARFAGVTFLVLQLWGGTVVLAQEAGRQLTVGKRGEFSLTSETKAGTLTLAPGRYILQHRVTRGDHAFHFVNIIPYEPSVSYVPQGEQKCKLEPLKAKSERTQVYLVDEDGAKRITRIEIKGENVAHVF